MQSRFFFLRERERERKRETERNLFLDTILKNDQAWERAARKVEKRRDLKEKSGKSWLYCIYLRSIRVTNDALNGQHFVPTLQITTVVT